MEGVLWYQLASSRGGPTRVRIVRALDTENLIGGVGQGSAGIETYGPGR